jgi:hypothetical protein
VRQKCHDADAIAYWLSDAQGQPTNYAGATTVELARVGLVQCVAGPLRLCSAQALHATLEPEKWKGERLWVVALRGEVQWDDEKLGALEREIIAEVVL